MNLTKNVHVHAGNVYQWSLSSKWPACLTTTPETRPGQGINIRAGWNLKKKLTLLWGQPSLKCVPRKDPGKVKVASEILAISSTECWLVYKNLAANTICQLHTGREKGLFMSLQWYEVCCLCQCFNIKVKTFQPTPIYRRVLKVGVAAYELITKARKIKIELSSSTHTNNSEFFNQYFFYTN